MMEELIKEMKKIYEVMEVIINTLSQRELNEEYNREVSKNDKFYLSLKYVENKLYEYVADMRQEELSRRTVEKYITDIRGWINEMPDVITKKDMLEYKELLMKVYSAATVRAKLIAINRYLKWLGYQCLTLKLPRVQKTDSIDKILSRSEYDAMIKYTEEIGNRKMYYILKTIANTGVRIGELRYITVESLDKGSISVSNKGKNRIIYLPESLCHSLKKYCEENRILSGTIFRGRNKEKAITTGAVWKNMKVLAVGVGISTDNVFPHALRHLFAREYMKIIGDITKLSSILGHNRLETTMIYTKTTVEEKRYELERLGF